MSDGNEDKQFRESPESDQELCRLSARQFHRCRNLPWFGEEYEGVGVRVHVLLAPVVVLCRVLVDTSCAVL